MYEFSEASLDLEKSYEYILSIQVSLNGFSFSILRPSDQILLYYKNIPIKISSNTLLVRRFKEWLESEEMTQKPFQKVRVIVFSEIITFVPTSFQHNNIDEDLLHLLFKDSDSLKFAENLIEKQNAKLLFAIPDDLNLVINNTIGEYKVIHPLKLIINSLLEMDEKQSLLLLFCKNYFQLVIIQNKIVLMANSFKINHANDILYFLITALNQFEISAQKSKLFYAGKSAFSDDSITSLKNRFSAIESFSANQIKNYNELPEKILSENISLFL